MYKVRRKREVASSIKVRELVNKIKEIGLQDIRGNLNEIVT